MTVRTNTANRTITETVTRQVAKPKDVTYTSRTGKAVQLRKSESQPGKFVLEIENSGKRAVIVSAADLREFIRQAQSFMATR